MPRALNSPELDERMKGIFMLMSDSNHPRIAFSERLSTGIVVHFEDGTSVLFSTQFLYENRDAPPNRVLLSNRHPD
jgi:hypothetical protein